MSELKIHLKNIKPHLKNYLLTKNYLKFLSMLTNTCLPFNRPKTKYDRTILTPYDSHDIYNLPTYVNYSVIDDVYIAASLPIHNENINSFKILLQNIDLIISCIPNPNYIDEVIISTPYFYNNKIVFYDEIVRINLKKFRSIRFANWIDHDILNIHEFLFFFNFYKKIKVNKVLVHCEAGVGRTGTIIAYDLLSKYKHVDIDLFVDTMCKLREKRNGIVYSVKQLKFLIDNFLDNL